jgi:flavin reductase (DIM6/NTAB) family NADH-FMN oxidoreductase RutF
MRLKMRREIPIKIEGKKAKGNRPARKGAKISPPAGDERLGKKQAWKPGNMLYPLPAVLVTVADSKGRDNIITVAWTGTVCTNPPMVYISVRPERHSYHMIEETGEFAINLTTESLLRAVDYCGVKSGRDVDKFKEMHLTRQRASEISAPLLGESPVNIECRVRECKKLGSHHMFLADVLCVHVSEEYMDKRGKFSLEQAKPIAYSHGSYFRLGAALGTFGYSIQKKRKLKKKRE